MKRLANWLGSHRALCRKGVMALVMVAVTVAAFYWGRMGVASRVDAQQMQPRAVAAANPNQAKTDYQRRDVAYIYDNIPITREELGEYLIARFGQERIEFLINRRLVEMQCQAKNIYVTDAEVDMQFRDELKGFGTNMTAQDFANQVLKRFNKSLYEWKEDVIRPKLLLAKLCRPMVQVTEQDLVKAFEARYGPKVQCRMIAFAKDNRKMAEIWTKVSQSETEFANEAKIQYLANLASKGGEIPPINKHFGNDVHAAKIEKAAFELKPGQVTPLMEMPDGTYIVLKCDKHLPADATKTFESVRLELDKEMREVKLTQKMQEYITELRRQAHPRVMIGNQVRQEDLERTVARDLNLPGSNQPRPTAPVGN